MWKGGGNMWYTKEHTILVKENLANLLRLIEVSKNYLPTEVYELNVLLKNQLKYLDIFIQNFYFINTRDMLECQKGLYLIDSYVKRIKTKMMCHYTYI